ncbi:MAG: molecular chaperone DnaK [Blastocatellia bacterium]|nr:molecular chaperone DnaK [Blastocatellia bacterium]
MPASRVNSMSPWHIVLVLDDSGSMIGSPADEVNNAVTAMIDELKLMTSGMKPYFKLSVITFGTRPELVCEAVSEQAVDMNKAASLKGDSGSTNAEAALEEAYQLLRKNPGAATDFTPYIFFLSDGAPDDVDAALAAGDKLKKMSIAAGTPKLVTIGFGPVNDDFMQKLASNTEMYKKLQDYRQIVKIFPAIGTIAQTATGTEGMDQAIMNL